MDILAQNENIRNWFGKIEPLNWLFQIQSSFLSRQLGCLKKLNECKALILWGMKKHQVQIGIRKQCLIQNEGSQNKKEQSWRKIIAWYEVEISQIT